ncbi:MAG: arginine--tRNA ligase [Parcubacteria group bacterium GW2011_GWA2_38_13b]|nr:MAG: arginine--tRNA ligase [Parcubacteria group bacterium GW2011_GWA2_38_13b]
MLREEIKNLLEKAVYSAVKDKKLPDFGLPEKAREDFWRSVTVEHPENKDFGDYFSNAALRLAKILRKPSMEIAEIIAAKISRVKEMKKYFTRAEVAKPGFINFYLSPDYLRKSVAEIIKKGDKFGDLKIGKGEKVQLEFISANPTGPLTIANGRGGFMGDVLRNVMKTAGYKAEAEYFINDSKHSNQIRELGKTILGKGEMYKSEYLNERLADFKVKFSDIEGAGSAVANEIVKDHKEKIKNKFNIKFDKWFSEQSLYDKNNVQKILLELDETGFTHKKDGAVWLKTSERGDDEDRVLVRADGEPTYFLSDIAYHADKFSRGYGKIINFWGADHHGHVRRLKIAMEILGYDSSKVEIIIMQLVRLIKNGQEVKMSKRMGQYITLEELVDEVGLDVARFFFLMVSANRQVDFDMSLAKEKSEKNPVYYVQYAYARIGSILRKLGGEIKKSELADLKNLEEEAEFDLAKKLLELPEIIEDTARDFQVQRLPQYAVELARYFHNFYAQCRVISEDKKLSVARFALITATQIALRKILGIMGVSAPEKM